MSKSEPKKPESIHDMALVLGVMKGIMHSSPQSAPYYKETMEAYVAVCKAIRMRCEKEI